MENEKKTIKAYKDFNSELRCKDFQYEAGKEYETYVYLDEYPNLTGEEISRRRVSKKGIFIIGAIVLTIVTIYLVLAFVFLDFKWPLECAIRIRALFIFLLSVSLAAIIPTVAMIIDETE